MGKILGGVIVAVLVGGLISSALGLGGDDSDRPGASEPSRAPVAETPAGHADRTHVPWRHYAPAVKLRIDRMEQRGNCAGLQKEFDTADANSDLMMDRRGHSNAALMGYIDEALQAAGCY